MPEQIRFALAVDLDNDRQQELVLSGSTTYHNAPRWNRLGTDGPTAPVAASSSRRRRPRWRPRPSAYGSRSALSFGQRRAGGLHRRPPKARQWPPLPIRRVVFSDFDDDRDVDFFALSDEGACTCIATTATARSATWLLRHRTADDSQDLAAEDVDQDGYMDLILANATSIELWHNEAGMRFTQQQTVVLPEMEQLLSADVDNDGDLDLWALGSDGAVLLAWYEGEFQQAERILKGTTAYPAVVADFDETAERICGALASWSTTRQRAAAGFASRYRVSTVTDPALEQVEIKTENRLQKREVRGNGNAEEELLFGLAENDSLEFVRILWPGGVRQTELATGASQRLSLKELDRKGTSCPILYAWDGEQCRFVTDILGRNHWLLYRSRPVLLPRQRRIRAARCAVPPRTAATRLS